MTIKQKVLGFTLTSILITAIGVGASGAMAQNDGNTTPTPPPPGTSDYGWNMHGMMWGNWHGDSMWTAVANALGIDVNALFTELQSGSTLAQIAEERNVDVQTVYDAALTTMTDHMNAMVETGYITQAQADAQFTWMRDNIAQMPIFNGTGFGPGMMGGMMGNVGSNMMSGMMGSTRHGGMMSDHRWNGVHDNWEQCQRHGG
ncbi:MAG TPA: hypothetical protein PLQ56_16325 [Aggregatilineales bacterium]|nr:hypothetical protein [Aggregatilineales bacterium]